MNLLDHLLLNVLALCTSILVNLNPTSKSNREVLRNNDILTKNAPLLGAMILVPVILSTILGCRAILDFTVLMAVTVLLPSYVISYNIASSITSLYYVTRLRLLQLRSLIQIVVSTTIATLVIGSMYVVEPYVEVPYLRNYVIFFSLYFTITGIVSWRSRVPF